jgi:hypothetical protein
MGDAVKNRVVYKGLARISDNVKTVQNSTLTFETIRSFSDGFERSSGVVTVGKMYGQLASTSPRRMPSMSTV